ncbi:FkbM family methyltransferase [Halomonas vilamensis]|uniref:FkbM family methyltransferase n=1 Tax=Vreelandella vilamensis TaxID=531309 RepID=A0ABU1H174_9GAMM|nr:FkbM family methyltransferase [Halomonas vilamensis]MDR5897969.1 FkbM family methyltransferase [Halomonas vilamensis]
MRHCAKHAALKARWLSTLGIARSLLIYWRPGRQRGLKKLYQPFLSPGALAFDIGAHLGDRSAAFHALGAHVVALEPHPLLARWCRRMIGDGVTLLPLAAGKTPGHAELAINPANLTVSTLADQWREQIGRHNAGFAHLSWGERERVDVTTLDALIAQYGEPAFIKIDVEGFEADVLAGLSLPVAALSVEFVSGALEVSHACVERLSTLGDYRYNIVVGEQRHFRWSGWKSEAEVHAWLTAGAEGLASGDIYACRTDHPLLSSSF